MIVELETGLKPTPAQGNPIDRHVEGLTDKKKNWRDNTVTQSLFPASHALPGDLGHRGIVRYLDDCYQSHQGIQVSPNMFWQLLLGDPENPIDPAFGFSRRNLEID